MFMPEFDSKSVRRWSLANYDRVWRTSPDDKGYCVLGADRYQPTSLELRRAMMDVVASFNRLAPRKFVIERLGRFDQQVSTRFHRDGGPDASLLILAYEPTTIRSDLYLHDPYSVCYWHRLTAFDYLQRFQPMTKAGEEELQKQCVSVLAAPSYAQIVVINNSAVLPDPLPGYPLGLLHKGLIRQPDPDAHRVINSMGLMLEGEPNREPVSPDRLAWFLEGETLEN